MNKEVLITGSKGGEQSHTPVETADNLKSSAYVEFVDLICEGEIEGLVTGDAKSLYLNGTPVQNSDGTYNYPDYTFTFLKGTQYQDPILGFDTVESGVSGPGEVKYSLPKSVTFSNANADAVRIIVAIPALVSYADNGDTNGSSLVYEVLLSVNGGTATKLIEKTVSGKTTSRYQLSHKIDLSAFRTSENDSFTLTLKKTSVDSSSLKVQSSLYFDSYTLISNTKLRYPNSVICASKVSSSQFSAVPTRGYFLKLLKVKLPTGYNPETRSYPTIWDGTLDNYAWTDNPVWCFYDLITNDRYGLGEYLDASLIDKWALYSIAQYCDELVPDGFGGTEPRFTLNAYIQSREDAIKLVTDLTSTFRAMVYWGGGLLTAVQDSSTSTPLMQFTNSNVVGGTFNYSGASKKVVHTAALVTWNDPSDQYKQKVEYVEDRESIARYGYNPTDVVAFGCTSRAQAHRVGKWLLYTERVESSVVVFSAGLEASYLTPGSIVKVFDESRAGVEFGGRILSSAISTLNVTAVLDRPVALTSGTQYYIRGTVISDGTLSTITQAIPTSQNGPSVSTLVLDKNSNTILLAPNMSWTIYSEGTIDEELYRVLSISESDSVGIYEISAIYHDPNKFDYIENNVELEDRVFSTISTIPGAVDYTKVTSSSGTFTDSTGSVRTNLNVGFERVEYAASYTVELKESSGNWVIVADKTTSTNITLQDIVPDSSYSVRITPFNILGEPGPAVTKETIAVNSTSSEVYAYQVQNFSATLRATDILLSWDSFTSVGFTTTYTIKLGSSFDTATEIVSGLTTNSFTVNPNTLGEYKFWIVYTFNILGDTSAPISTTINLEKPLPPIDLNTDGKAYSIRLSWDYQQQKVDLDTVQVWSSSTPDRANSVLLVELPFGTRVYTVTDLDAAEVVYFWLKVVDTRGNSSDFYPLSATNGIRGQANLEVSTLLGILADSITSSELAGSLSSRIDLIDASSSVEGSVDYKVLQEANRANAVNLSTTRLQLDSDKSLAESILLNTLNEDANRELLQGTIARASSTLKEFTIEGISAEATARQALETSLVNSISAVAADIETEETARVNAVSAEATARQTLATQFRGSYEGNDASQLTSGLLYQESVTRSNADNSLSQQITLLSAGAGEQFDWQSIWYFDSSIEDWTGNGTPTIEVSGWLRPANQTSNAYVISPTINVNAAKYGQVKLRVRAVGTPTFAGYLWWNTSTETTWDTSRRIALDEPVLDSNGIGLIPTTINWFGTVTQIKISLSDAQTSSNYYELDWVAIGRPSPGASSAQLLELERVTVDTSNATSLASKLSTLDATINNSVTGLVDTVANIKDTYTVIADIEESSASAQRTLLSSIGNPVRVIYSSTQPTPQTVVTTLEDGSTFSSSTINTGDIWFDTSNANTSYIFDWPYWVLATSINTANNTAFIDSLEETLTNPTTATTTLWKTAVSEVVDLNTGQSKLTASFSEIDNTIADETRARVSSIRTLEASSNSTDEILLNNILNLEDARKAQTAAVAFAVQELNTRTEEGLLAEATSRELLSTTVTGELASLSGNIESVSEALTTLEDSSVLRLSTIEARFIGFGTTDTVASKISDYAYSKVDADTAIATSTNALETTINGQLGVINSGLLTKETAKIGYCTGDSSILDKVSCEAAGRVWVAQPLATAVKQLSITAANGQTASIQQQFETIYGASGLNSQYSVKLDSNGYVSGFGLYNSGSSSEFIVATDKFAVIPPTVVGTEPVIKYHGQYWKSGSIFKRWNANLTTPAWEVVDYKLPFAVLTTQETINGELFEPGVYIDGASIAKSSIGNEQVDNLDATKIATGYLSADRIEAESITVAKIDTKLLTIKDANGTVIFGVNATVPATNLPDESLNSNVSLNSLGYLGALDATNGSSLVVSDFSSGMTNWTTDRDGSPSTVATIEGTKVTDDALFGVCGEFNWLNTSGEDILSKQLVTIVPSRVYKITATFKVVSFSSASSAPFDIIIASNASDYTIIGADDGPNVTATAIDTVYSASATICTDSTSGADKTFLPTARYFRAGLRLASSISGSMVVRIKSILIEDVTDSFSAQKALSSIASDAVLSKYEKPDVLNEWNVLTAEHARINIQSGAFSLVAESTTFNSILELLGKYLNGGVDWDYSVFFPTLPSWLQDLSTDQPIVGSDFRSAFTNYYTARQNMLNAIAAKAATMATWSGIPTGSGKPADNATRNKVFRQATAPTADMAAGDFWIKNTSPYSISEYNGTAWVQTGDLTSQNTAASIADQGAFATLSQITKANASTYIASTAIGSAFIEDAAITNAKIGSFIQSDNYVAGTSGWSINKTGDTEFRGPSGHLKIASTGSSIEFKKASGATSFKVDTSGNATFSGDITGSTGTFSGKLAAGVLDASAFAGLSYTYNSNQSFTIPTKPSDWSTMHMRVTLIGGGGGGGGGGSWTFGGGGGGGGGGAGYSSTTVYQTINTGSVYSIVVGAPGGGGSGVTAPEPYSGGGNGRLGYPGTSGGSTILYNPAGQVSLSASGGGGGGGGDMILGGVLGTGSINGQPGNNASAAGGSNLGGAGGGSGYGAGGRGGNGGKPSDSGSSGTWGVAIIEFFDPNFVVTNTRYQNLISWLNSRGIGTVPTNAI
jgi:predicted phage tail protein